MPQGSNVLKSLGYGRHHVLVSRAGVPIWWSPAFTDLVPRAALERSRVQGTSLFSDEGYVICAEFTPRCDTLQQVSRKWSEIVGAVGTVPVEVGEAMITALGPDIFAIGFAAEAKGDDTAPSLGLPTSQRERSATSAHVLMLCAESAEVAPWTIDPVTRQAWWSGPFFALLGYEPGGIERTSAAFRDLIHPDDLERASASMESLVTGAAQKYNAVFRLRRKDGTWRWYQSTAQITDGPDGAPLICGGLKDVNQTKEYEREREELLKRATAAKAAAKASEEMLRTSVALGDQTAWSTCHATGEAWMMHEGYTMLGYEPGEFRPDSEGWRNLIHPDDLDRAIEVMTAFINGETELYQMENRYRHKDGSYHWYRVLARKVDRSDQDLPPLIAGTTWLIDTLKEKEQRLSEALDLAEELRVEAKSNVELLRISLAAGDQLIWSICPKTGDAWLMEDGFAILGYSQDEFYPDLAGWRGLIHPDDVDDAVSGLKRFFKCNKGTFQSEQRLCHKDGSHHWYRTVAKIIDRRDAGLPRLIAGTMVCIDHLKEREKRLSEAVADAEAARAEAQQAAEILRVSSENSGVVPWFRIQEEDLFWFTDNIVQLLNLPAGTKVDLDDWISRVYPDDLPMVRAAIEAIETFETDQFDVELRVRRGDDSYIWCRSVGRRLRRGEQGFPDLISGALFGIDELKQNEMRQVDVAAELAHANERMKTIADNAPAGIYEYRQFPDGRFAFPYVSARFAELFGFTPSEVMETPEKLFNQIHEEDLPQFLSSISASAETLQNWTYRFRGTHVTRGMRWFSASSTPNKDDQGSVTWIGVLSDVTNDVERELALRQAHQTAERMRAENEMLALHDALTGLPNRRYFDQLFQSRLDQAAEGGPRDLCLIRIDLDKFKYINDTLGHEAGDKALQQVGRVLNEYVRDGDFAARIGGDEFSVILAACNNEDAAKAVITRIRSHLEVPIEVGARSFQIRASFGVAYTENVLDIGRDLQLFADTALYTAKESGRNRIEFFTPALHHDILAGRSLAADLQDAIVQDQFIPFFQPQVSAADCSLVGIETLVRWQHPAQGLLTPDRFMRLAEQMRIMPEIDRIIYRRALAYVREWEQEGMSIPKISFNISSGRMRDAAILEDTASNCGKLDAKISFELLESILIENESQDFKSNLQEVRNRGVDIEIDDFGSGHASIVSITAIEPSALKIDRRLIDPVGTDPKHVNVIRGIISIAETLGVATIAEGVETPDQARLLTDAGCDALQGYLFARPLSPNDFRDYYGRTQPIITQMAVRSGT